MTGAQLKKYMEWTVSYYNTYKPGDLTISFSEDMRAYNPYLLFTSQVNNYPLSQVDLHLTTAPQLLRMNTNKSPASIAESNKQRTYLIFQKKL